MSFTAPEGTRGVPLRGGRLMRWMNNWMVGRIRRTGKAPLMGFNALVLTTVGRKSGLERHTPVGWFPGKDGSWIIVASAAGAPKHPDWYRNLAANPDKARIETAGKKADVTAEELHGPEREETWKTIVDALPQFRKYQEKTDRELPVIRLTPRAS